MIGVVPEKRLSKSSKLKIMGALSFLTVALTLKYRYHTTTASVYDAIGTNLAKTGDFGVGAGTPPCHDHVYGEPGRSQHGQARVGDRRKTSKDRRFFDDLRRKAQNSAPKVRGDKGVRLGEGFEREKGRCEPHRKRIK